MDDRVELQVLELTNPYTINKYEVKVKKSLRGAGLARDLKQVGFEVNGTGGFGYDPVFHCNEAGCSMALLPDGGKNLYSHRGKAARSILKLIKE